MHSWQEWLVAAGSAWVSRGLPVVAWWTLCLRNEGLITAEKEEEIRHKLRIYQLIVSLIAGVAAFIFLFQWGFSVETIIALHLLWFLLLLSLTDLWARVIPNLFTYSGILLFLFMRLLEYPQPITHYLLSFVVALGGCWLIGWVTGGLGGGDAKLLAMSAWVIGWPHVLTAFWFATFSASFYIGWRWLRGQGIGWGEPFPFGPHLSLGILAAHIWGERLFEWYRFTFFYY